VLLLITGVTSRSLGCRGHARLMEGDRVVWHRIVYLVLGALLLVAAVLKTHQLATEPVVGNGLLESRWFLALVVQFEILLGLWLISGLFACAAWWVALWTFGAFTVVAAAKGIAGEPSCGCFGRVETSPWLTLTIDIAAVIALGCCAVPGLPSGRKASMGALPGIGSSSDTASAAAGFSPAYVWLLGLWLTTASGLGFFTVRGAASAPLAAIGQRVGDVILVQPDQMIGQRFELGRYTDIGQQLAQGRWLVVFYNARCPECERLKEYWSTSWAEIRGQGNTAFVSVPPDLTGTTPALHGVRWGALDSGIDWFIQTPLVVAIQDNRVVEARIGATDGIDLTFSWLLSDRTREFRRETYAF
jgi:hypothetical protein